MRIALLIYAAGVAIGLLRSDARVPARIGLAVLWPLGPIAFALTVSILLLTSLVAFPVFGLIILSAAAVGYALLN